MLQIGIVFNVTADGPSYTPTYRYGASGSEGFFNDVQIAAGDAIKLTVNAPVDVKLGIVTVQNLNNNQKATNQFNLLENLCGKTAEWVPVNFGTLIFANAEVGGDDFGQLDRELFNIAQNGKPLTNVTADNDSVTVTWL
ncbi:hypothetical protein L210DRAFT_3547275 [Boletus edulis BED1]|uniref:Uncharacterized protein n=1 Tax=Boletus edulis BED1 TaxID=1328754 RepID=A0AAD4GD63_BOLED|nr:hypothetical protein L210DRAFT_3547275 [Boletus edulis BED1]